MKKEQKIKHSIYGIGVINSVYAPDTRSHFKGGITIGLSTVKGINQLSYDRDNLYAYGQDNDPLTRIFESDMSKIIKL